MTSKDWNEFDLIGELLGKASFTYAKTMPHNPHHYTLRKKWNDDEFVWSVQYIRDNGYPFMFGGRRYIQLDVNGYYYWTMGAPLSQTTLINRKDKLYLSPYDHVTSGYLEVFSDEAYLEEDRQLMIELGELDESVLDIGCGHGLLLDHKSPSSYTGIDPSMSMIQEAMRQHEGAGEFIPVKLADYATMKRFGTVIALYGTASYLSVEELLKIRHLLSDEGQAFLMFYAEGYTPVTHLMMNEMPVYRVYSGDIPGATVSKFGNYDIVRFGK